MKITLEYVPLESDWEDMDRIINKIYAEKPLYAFLILTIILLCVMIVRQRTYPESASTVFIIVSAGLFAGGSLFLYKTKKHKPEVRRILRSTIGNQQRITFADGKVYLPEGMVNEKEYPDSIVLGQYCTDRYYIAFLASHPQSILIVKMTSDIRDALNQLAQMLGKKRVPLKKLRV